MFTTQDDCTKATVQDAKIKMKTEGDGPLGKFNKNYMAYTWPDALNDFNNPLTHQHGNLSAMKPSSSKFPSTQTTGSCINSQTKFPYCSACPAITDLGPGRFPRYINEVVCQSEGGICGPQANGFCKTTVIIQQFLVASCDSSGGKENLDSYSQPIRSCCECFLF